MPRKTVSAAGLVVSQEGSADALLTRYLTLSLTDNKPGLLRNTPPVLSGDRLEAIR